MQRAQRGRPVAEDLIIDLQHHGLTGRNVEDRVGPEAVAGHFNLLAAFFVFIDFAGLDDLVGARPGKFGAVELESDAADGTVRDTHFVEVFGHIVAFKTIGALRRAAKVHGEAIIHVDGLLGIVLQPVGHPDGSEGHAYIDIKIFADNLHFRYLERNRIAGTDRGGIADHGIAVCIHQGRQQRQRQQGKKILFHSRFSGLFDLTYKVTENPGISTP